MSDDREYDDKYKLWSRAVKTAGNFQCFICGAKDVYLESHHLNAWNAFPEQRYLLNNGRCVCKLHHDLFHQLYLKGNNTADQFNQFVEIYKVLRKVAENQLEKKEKEK